MGLLPTLGTLTFEHPFFRGRMANQPIVTCAAFVAAAFVVLSGGPVNAQRPESVVRHAAYGFIAGVNVAKVAGGDIVNATTRTGFTGGAYVALPIATGVALQPEVLYSMEGAKLDIGENGGLKADYVRVPVMLRFAIPTASIARPFMAFGPSFGFETNCEVNGSNGSVSISESCDDFARSAGSGFEPRKFDVAARIEAGFTLDTGGKRFIVGGAYSHGLTDVFKDRDVKNRVFSVFVGIGL